MLFNIMKITKNISYKMNGEGAVKCELRAYFIGNNDIVVFTRAKLQGAEGTTRRAETIVGGGGGGGGGRGGITPPLEEFHVKF